MTMIFDGTNGVTFPNNSVQNVSAANKNRIINGAMTIAQRATSATITSGSTIAAGYATVDRWYAYCTGASVTMAQVAGAGSVKNNLQITGAASVTAIGIGQRIESQNSYDLAGSTATLSVNMSNSLLTNVTWTAYYANTADTFGTLASTTRTQIATGTFTITSTLTNYNAQISVPSAATTGIEIVFTVGAQTSGTWVIGNVQLEKGSVATSFDYRIYSDELAMCQRYFQNFLQTSPVLAAAPASGNYLGTSILLTTPMRSTPTVFRTNSGLNANRVWSDPPNAHNGICSGETTSTVFLSIPLTGLTAGTAYQCNFTAGVGYGYPFLISAEL